MPNLVVAALTKESVNNALGSGISADQVILRSLVYQSEITIGFARISNNGCVGLMWPCVLAFDHVLGSFC